MYEKTDANFNFMRGFMFMRGRFYDTPVVEVERERFPTEFDFTSSRNNTISDTVKLYTHVTKSLHWGVRKKCLVPLYR